MNTFTLAMIKAASGHTTYNYSTYASERNYDPGKSTIKPGVVRINTGVEEKRAEIPTSRIKDVPKASRNQDSYQRSYPFNTFLHSFSPSVSGTGYGRPYWPYKDNPFQD